MDKKKIEKAVYEILEAVGEDPNRPGLVETPAELRICMRKCFAA